MRARIKNNPSRYLSRAMISEFQPNLEPLQKFANAPAKHEELDRNAIIDDRWYIERNPKREIA